MQRQVKIEGTLAECPACKRQPKHWLDMRQGGTHALECSPCGTRTPLFSTFQEAVEYWERHDRLEYIRGKA